MKTKTLVIVLLLSLAALPLFAGEAENRIQLRISQIELDVALKQYEKAVTLLSDAQMEARLIETNELTEAQVKKWRENIEQKMGRLTDATHALRTEVQSKGALVEELRRASNVAEAPGKK